MLLKTEDVCCFVGACFVPLFLLRSVAVWTCCRRCRLPWIAASFAYYFCMFKLLFSFVPASVSVSVCMFLFFHSYFCFRICFRSFILATSVSVSQLLFIRSCSSKTPRKNRKEQKPNVENTFGWFCCFYLIC